MSAVPRVAICADFREEGWPSMDRIADQLVAHLSAEHAGAVTVSQVCPPFRKRASALWQTRLAATIDRGWNRLIDYPRHVGALRDQYDVFHVVDHSYSQLVHRLPPERTVVTCHDLDTFRSLIQPTQEPRSWPFRAMTRHILAGLQRAACITCDTAAVRQELLAHNLAYPERIVVVPIGVGDEFTTAPDPEIDREVAQLIGSPPGAIEILHVGSTIPRKRIDVLLNAVSMVRREQPLVRLVRVGGAFSQEQLDLVRRLDLADCVSVLPLGNVLSDARLAAVYRRAAMLVLPSDREGFGLPIVEAMRCGTPVVASDLPVLREVSGGLARHFSPGEANGCAAQMLAVLRERIEQPTGAADRREREISWASQFTWSQFADRLANIYSDLCRGPRPVASRRSATCPA
jgi:glycosyltransferase involved in cell wall biosynthesis